MRYHTLRKILFILILLLFMLGAALQFLLFERTQTSPLPFVSATTSSTSYERIEIWDLRGNDTVRFTILDTYVDALKRNNWLSIPLVWNDTDLTEAAPLSSTLIEHRVEDRTYSGQDYRSHSYIIESDQRQFGYTALFKVLPHVHFTGTTSRLLSIGVDPSRQARKQSRFVIAVVLPDGASAVTVTDMQPYKTLIYSNRRALYYYDVHSITSHQSIHISYTLTDIPTTGIDASAIISYSNP